MYGDGRPARRRARGARSWSTPRPRSRRRPSASATASQAQGARYIDAPLARTPKEAEEGRLNTMVGATDADFARAEAGAAGLLREHLPRRPAGHRPRAEAGQQHARDVAWPRRSPRRWRSRPRPASPLEKLYEVVSAGGVNSGIFQMMVGQHAAGRPTGLKFAIAQRAEGPALLHPPRRVAAGRELHGRGRAPELRAGREPRASATSSSPRCSRRRSRLDSVSIVPHACSRTARDARGTRLQPRRPP